jgi:hypothetical protein
MELVLPVVKDSDGMDESSGDVWVDDPCADVVEPWARTRESCVGCYDSSCPLPKSPRTLFADDTVKIEPVSHVGVTLPGITLPVATNNAVDSDMTEPPPDYHLALSEQAIDGLDSDKELEFQKELARADAFQPIPQTRSEWSALVGVTVDLNKPIKSSKVQFFPLCAQRFECDDHGKAAPPKFPRWHPKMYPDTLKYCTEPHEVQKSKYESIRYGKLYDCDSADSAYTEWEDGEVLNSRVVSGDDCMPEEFLSWSFLYEGYDCWRVIWRHKRADCTDEPVGFVCPDPE